MVTYKEGRTEGRVLEPKELAAPVTSTGEGAFDQVKALFAGGPQGVGGHRPVGRPLARR